MSPGGKAWRVHDLLLVCMDFRQGSTLPNSVVIVATMTVQTGIVHGGEKNNNIYLYNIKVIKVTFENSVTDSSRAKTPSSTLRLIQGL